MATQKPTIYTVAEAAGVSITTVSDVLNGRDRVSVDTAAQVRTVMAELGMTNSWGVDSQWENNILRVAERQENDIDRLKALGNAVVPHFAELTGRLVIRSLIQDTLVFDQEVLG